MAAASSPAPSSSPAPAAGGAHEAQDYRQGLLELLAAALLFSVMSALVKQAGKSLPSELMVLARNAVIFVASLIWLRRQGVSPWGNRRGLLFVRGLFGTLGLFAFFYSLTALPLAAATTIFLVNPVFTALLAALLLGERLTLRLGVGLLVALSGVILASRPATWLGGDAALDPVAVAICVGGALAAAFAYVTVRTLRATESALVVVFWFAFVSLPFAVVAAIPRFVMPDAAGFALLAGVGVATLAAQVLLTRGLMKVPAGAGTAVGYTQIIVALVVGLVLFDEPVRPDGVGGAVLVAVGVALATLRRTPKG